MTCRIALLLLLAAMSCRAADDIAPTDTFSFKSISGQNKSATASKLSGYFGGGSGGDSNWTNSSGVLKPFTIPNRVEISATNAAPNILTINQNSSNVVYIRKDGGIFVGNTNNSYDTAANQLGFQYDMAVDGTANVGVGFKNSDSATGNSAAITWDAEADSSVNSEWNLDSHVGSNSSYSTIDIMTSPLVGFDMNHIEWDMLDGTNTPIRVLSFRPSVQDGSTAIFHIDSYLPISGGNLFEVANDGTNKFSVNYAGAVSIAGGAPIKRVLSATATLDFDLSAVTFQDLTVNVTGAAVGDVVSLGVPEGSIANGISYFGRVSASDTVKVRASTSTGTPNPASGTFRVMVTQF